MTLDSFVLSIVNYLVSRPLYFPLFLFIYLILRLIVISGGLHLFTEIYSEKFKKRKLQSEPRYPGQVLIEIKHSLISLFTMSLVCWPIIYLMKEGRTSFFYHWNDFPIWWTLISVLICFVWHDFFFWALHRILHLPWFYKKIHYVHHLSKVPSAFASHSFHWIEGGLQILCVYPIILFVPIHPLVFIIYMALSHFFAAWGHMNYEFGSPKMWFHPLYGWGATATHHNDHHKYNNGNFGLYLKVWDMKFGILNPNTELNLRKLKERIFNYSN